MKKGQTRAVPRRRISCALTWDGARWPIKKLPPKAQAFLAGKSKNLSIPTAREASWLFANDEIKEIRVCWIPQLKGGQGVLTEPFAVPAGKRLGFSATRITRLGDILGVIYQRQPVL
jgi:hypothetical protein